MTHSPGAASWQCSACLGMRLVFSAEEGFKAKHTYLVRVVQGVGANEKILAEGDFLLEQFQRRRPCASSKRHAGLRRHRLP